MSSKETHVYYIVGPSEMIPQEYVRNMHTAIADLNLKRANDDEFPIIEVNFKFSEYIDDVYLYDKTEADKKFVEDQKKRIDLMFNPVSRNTWYDNYLKRMY